MARYTPDTMILSKTLEHRQAYTFKLHQAKLELLQDTLSHPQDFQRLRNYLFTVVDAPYPHHLFSQDVPEHQPNAPVHRSSQTNLDLLPAVTARKENLANDLAVLGLMRAKRNKERHEQIQDFMLINDTSTVACEVPVYLTADHVRYFRQAGFHISIQEEDTPITGHIDLVQVRQGFIHILDYKPDARKIQPTSQLTLYALALASHTRLPLKLFKCAWFDDKNYFEFYPLHCVYRK